MVTRWVSRSRAPCGRFVAAIAAALCATLLSHPATGQQAEPQAKQDAPQAAAPAATVTITAEQLVRFAKMEVELADLRKRYDELQRTPPTPILGLGSTPNLTNLKAMFSQQAQRLGQVITKGVFCSNATGSVGDDLAIQINGTARDASDVEKARALLEADGFYALLKGVGFVNVLVRPDGGQSGGCVVDIAPDYTVTKQSPDDFATPMHSELGALGSLSASIPDKGACGQIGQLMIQFRNDAARVPVRKRQSFTAFWVRDGEDFTLCREDGGDWRIASKLLVKPSWEGVLVLHKTPNK